MVMSKENGENRITLRFNDAEWEKIERGTKWLYADKRISKPTTYGFLKWCGLTFSSSLEKKHGGGGD